MPQEQGAYQAYDYELLGQLGGEILDRRIDQLRAVIRGNDLHAVGQALLKLFELRLDRGDCGSRVGPLTQDHHPAGDLALTVELRYPAPQLGSDLDGRYVAQRHRDSSTCDLQGDRPKIIEAAKIAG